MTRLYLTSLILCMLCFNVNADNLPPGITNRLSIAGYDLDQNGVIDTFESLNVKTLSWYGNDGDINKYLKYFRNLDSLNLINDFVVVDVDLSLNENLKYISYNISNIEKIQFSTPNIIEKIIPNANFFSIPSIRQFVHAQINETASLEYKDVEIDPSINPLANYTFTQLDSIKTGEVKHLYHLEALISSAPNLVYLHMGKINDEGDMHFNCPELRYLRMHGYDAINPTFDLPKIEILIIPGNGINNDILDLSSTDNLKYLDCSLAKYEEIIFGDLENLEYLDCSRNRLSSLILENTPNLKSLFCNNNNNLLKTLELHNAPVLETLHCYTNKISALDVSNLNNLKVLFAGENKIENLNVSNLIKLERLECNDNLIQNLDLSNSTKLYNFECQNNLIESLNLNNLDSLINLTCSNNNLTSLALSNQHYLQKLECYDNSISELNVEDAFSLRELRCSNNNLTELNVNNNLYLDYLDCSNNQLETLTILNITSHNIVLDENPELSMICCDNHEVVEIQSLVDGLGYTCEVNSDCSSEVILNYVYIPFDGVRNSLLLENNLDINKDNRLSFDEVEDITHLEISRIGRSSNDNAFPLDGLEAFQNLQSLHINENFTELNAKPLRINDFLELEELIFLGEIDHPTIIENLPKVREIEIRSNESLLIQNMTNLERLIIVARDNQAEVFHLENLRYFEAHGSQFWDSDIHFVPQQMPLLDTLILYEYNGEDTGILNLSHNQNLKYLLCHQSKLTGIQTSNDDYQLEYLDLFENEIGILNLESFPQLEYLRCEDEELTTLDLSYNPFLKHVNCRNNMLSGLNFDNNLELEFLDCSNTFGFDNNFNDLSLENHTKLKELYCFRTKIDSLNLSNNAELEILDCSLNDIQNIDLSHNTKLKDLNLSYYFDLNEKLDLSNNTNIESLKISGDSLQVLDLSELSNLKDLKIHLDVKELYVKNGASELLDDFSYQTFAWSPSLEYICMDEEERECYETKFLEFGIETVKTSNYCEYNNSHYNNLVSGLFYFDTEGNGCTESAMAIPAPNMTINDGTEFGYFTFGQDSMYMIELTEGSYSLKPVIANPSYFEVSPTDVQINFPPTGDSIIQDFCVSKTELDYKDLEVILLPLTQLRPGFSSRYELIIKNIGNVATSSELELSYESTFLTLESASPNVDTQNDNLLKWQIDIFPFETKKIFLEFKVNTPNDADPLFGGEILRFDATVDCGNQDVNLSNNTYELSQTVVNSYDPNDKRCLEGDYLKEEMIGDYVNYIIRFENNGTASAIDIVVKDIIDTSQFDIRTLEVTSSSAPYELVRRDGKIFEFFFKDINLPFEDEFNDGHIAFRVKTWPYLEVGDVLENRADIYFDFNAPIFTNTAKTELVRDMDEDGWFSHEDCDDFNPDINPDAMEITYDGLDNDCNPTTLDDDLDQDGFVLADDCNDDDPNINPDAAELAENGIDEDCDGEDWILSSTYDLDRVKFTVYPSPATDVLFIKSQQEIQNIELLSLEGKLILSQDTDAPLNISTVQAGFYLCKVRMQNGKSGVRKVVVK